MAQRLRLGSALAIGALHRLAYGTRCERGQAGGSAVWLKPEEERPRPRCAGDRSGNGGERAVARALPREAVIEYQNLVGSALPLADQPGSRLQLGASARPRRARLPELLCDLPQPALQLGAQTAQSEFLQAICNSTHQQLAAEV